MRPRLAIPLLAIVVMLPAGCGGKYELPTEHRSTSVPTDKSYAMLATWKFPESGRDTVQDLLLTQGQGDQLFALLRHTLVGGFGRPVPVAPVGVVNLYPLTGNLDPTTMNPRAIGAPYFNPLQALFNPIAIASAASKLFVLDQGDSCTAKYDPRRDNCAPDEDTTHVTGHPFRSMVFDYTATWRVREYGLGGGDTVSTFTDTTVAQPWGIAADEQGRVYVAGTAVILDTLQTDQRIRTRKFVSRVYRYSRGPKYLPDVLDVNMPGTMSWHRDTSWVVFDGTGASSVSDPRGIYWSRTGVNPLFIADRLNNQVKGVSTNEVGVSIVRVDGQETGANLDHPESVTADLAGFFYMVDRNNRRVLRYDLTGQYIQRVDVEANSDGLPLLDPISIAVDDSLAYVADHGRNQIVRYRRRP
jgi:hypothetical protein